MMTWVALIGCLTAQDPAGDARKEMEELRRENAELRDMVRRLRQTLRDLEGQTPAGPPLRTDDFPPKAGTPGVSGPEKPLGGKVTGVNSTLGFCLIGIGEQQGVKPGYRFEILRQVYEDPNAAPKTLKIAVAEFERYIGEDSKLRIVEGKAGEIKVDDEAWAIRALGPVRNPNPVPEKQGLYRITGKAGSGHVVNYGTLEGARQTDVVFVYRDGKLKTKLRLDEVKKDFSVGSAIPGGPGPDPEEGDQVFVRELKKSLTGRVLGIDHKGTIIVDLGTHHGAKVGQKFEARRLGKKIGTVTLIKVEKYRGDAAPSGDTQTSDIQNGDYLELIEDMIK